LKYDARTIDGKTANINTVAELIEKYGNSYAAVTGAEPPKAKTGAARYLAMFHRNGLKGTPV
jgi:hypothetical protein